MLFQFDFTLYKNDIRTHYLKVIITTNCTFICLRFIICSSMDPDNVKYWYVQEFQWNNVPVTWTVARICINHRMQCTLSILMFMAEMKRKDLVCSFFYLNINFFLHSISPFLVVQIICKWNGQKHQRLFFTNLWSFKTTISWHFILLLTTNHFCSMHIHDM